MMKVYIRFEYKWSTYKVNSDTKYCCHWVHPNPPTLVWGINGEEPDCHGVCGGTTEKDECGVCGGTGVNKKTQCCPSGINEGKGPNGEEPDCSGKCEPPLEKGGVLRGINDCGVCVEAVLDERGKMLLDNGNPIFNSDIDNKGCCNSNGAPNGQEYIGKTPATGAEASDCGYCSSDGRKKFKKDDCDVCRGPGEKGKYQDYFKSLDSMRMEHVIVRVIY